MKFICPLCSRDLVPYGESALTCEKGHHFMVDDIAHERAIVKERVTVQVVGRSVTVPAWVPGAVLGGLALLITLVEVIL